MSDTDLKERVLRLEKLIDILLEQHPKCLVKAAGLLNPKGKLFQKMWIDEYQGEFLPKADEDDQAS